VIWVALALAAAVLILIWPQPRSTVPLVVICEDGSGLEGVVRHAAASGRSVYVRAQHLSDESAAILALLETDLTSVRRLEGEVEDVLDQSLAPVAEVTRVGPGTDVAAIIRALR